MRQACRGFTLLELMVVMVLIGVLLGMVSLATGTSPARLARQEANGLIQLLQALREQAVLEGREYGLRLEPEGYQVLALYGQDWRPAGRAYRLPEGLQLRLEQSGQMSTLAGRPGQPHLVLLSSDESSAFTLHLQADQQSLISLSSDGLNEAALDE
ncbi:type II secretion system protein GspH [Pseudomonas brassicacearum]|uniref:Type II secretion system protein H n=1 Tax=Pseudomonas brassicacearum TaxID=930166 RepID=A0A423HC33_9PSED|nr:type II secretion system minor pseudopilin GspH [Pseudomonas brassicacearum]RON10744.1 type II secretion system protein GspH [Pseudomonas brassicacearum]